MSEPTKAEIRDTLIQKQKGIVLDLDRAYARAMSHTINDCSGAALAMEIKSKVLVTIYEIEKEI